MDFGGRATGSGGGLDGGESGALPAVLAELTGLAGVPFWGGGAELEAKGDGAGSAEGTVAPTPESELRWFMANHVTPAPAKRSETPTPTSKRSGFLPAGGNAMEPVQAAAVRGSGFIAAGDASNWVSAAASLVAAAVRGLSETGAAWGEG